MANSEKITQYYNRIRDLILDSHLSEAIAKLKFLFSKLSYPALSARLGEVENTYSHMLRYMAQGGNDTSRERIYADIIDELLYINELFLRESRIPDNRDIYSEIIRNNRQRQESLKTLLDLYTSCFAEYSLAQTMCAPELAQIKLRKEELTTAIFNRIWTGAPGRGDLKALKDYLLSAAANDDLVAVIVSAMTLALLQHYNPHYFDIMLDMFEFEVSDKVRGRIIIAIVFCESRYGHLLNRNRYRRDRLRNIIDRHGISHAFKTSLLNIVRTRDTEKVIETMNKEVIPQLMKLNPEILEQMRKGSFDPEISVEGNPEWESILEKSGLSEKLRKLSDMQSDGTDVMMVAFANLKNFPFFREPSNWFLPFDSSNSAIHHDCDSDNRLIEILNRTSGMMCDSDKYSLMLAIAKMPEAQRDMMRSQLDMQLSQLDEEGKDRFLHSGNPALDDEIMSATRDLYRFFKLFRRLDGLYNPFARNIDFKEFIDLDILNNDVEIVRLISEFYFKRNCYAEARPLLEILGNRPDADGLLWEKIGYCCEQTGDLSSALEAYTRAELLSEATPWLITRLAEVNKKLHNYKAAALYYEQLVLQNPEKVSYLVNLGDMLLQDGKYSEAITKYQQARYYNPEDIRILRANAWAELSAANYEKSQDYYSQILLTAPIASDYLNAGHSALLYGNIRTAIDFYRHAIEAHVGETASDNPKVYRDALNDFENLFNADRDFLVSRGVDPLVPPMLVDYMRMTYSKGAE